MMLRTVLTVAALAAGGYAVKNQMNRSRGPGASKRMSTTTESVEVDVPVSTTYNQWTQFEDFPRFMAGVLEVHQLDNTHLRWRAEIAGKQEEWDSEITEQTPDRVIAWRSTGGAHNTGHVSFQPLSANRTRIELRIDYEPRGLTEKIGDAMGAVSMRASGNLQRFKQFIERRGVETGAWRGTVSGGQERGIGIGSSGMGSTGSGDGSSLGGSGMGAGSGRGRSSGAAGTPDAAI